MLEIVQILLLRYLDCAVIEELHTERESQGLKAFDTVRGLFHEGEQIYNTSGFFEKTHIQICVRNPNCIKGFLHRERLTRIGVLFSRLSKKLLFD